MKFKIILKRVFYEFIKPRKVFLFYTILSNFIYSETISFKFQILSLGLIFIIVTFIVFGLIILFSNFFTKNFLQIIDLKFLLNI